MEQVFNKLHKYALQWHKSYKQIWLLYFIFIKCLYFGMISHMRINWRRPDYTCADPGIFVREGGGGVQVNLTNKDLTTFFFYF